MYLLDTNVISELARTPPDAAVLLYFRRLRRDVVFTSAVCEAEIRYGLARLPAGRRRSQLTARTDALFASVFFDHVLPLDRACAARYGTITAHRDAIGMTISAEDGMIAATAQVHGAALLTRNVRDFVDCGIAVIDPWTASPP